MQENIKDNKNLESLKEEFKKRVEESIDSWDCNVGCSYGVDVKNI